MRKDWADIVFSKSTDSASLSRAVKRGTLRRLAHGIYTGNLIDDPDKIVRQNVWAIVGHEIPGAVVVDRSARAGGPSEGRLLVDADRRRPLNLPGLTVIARRGSGPINGDMPMPNGLWLSSTPRQLLDNLRRSQRSSGFTLAPEEVEEWVDQLLAERGPEGLNRIREEARTLAPLLGRDSEFVKLEVLIRAALTTGDVRHVRSTRLRARALGQPFDSRRISAFEHLVADLNNTAPTSIPLMDVDEDRRTWLPFYEAYFSNYIEGTEFTIDEAVAIVFGGDVPHGRPADAHDILSTYEMVVDPVEMSMVPNNSDEFEQLLRSRHSRLMSARPELLPGDYKRVNNRAGVTFFVSPELVQGTLRRAFELGQSIASPFARAVYMMFVVAEVHPFTDGNGRMARIMMNAELVAAGEARIIVPTVYRANYLSALRGATHNNHFAALRATLEFAQRFTAQLDFTSRESAELDLNRTNAFRESIEAEKAGLRLRLPLDNPGHHN